MTASQEIAKKVYEQVAAGAGGRSSRPPADRGRRGAAGRRRGGDGTPDEGVIDADFEVK